MRSRDRDTTAVGPAIIAGVVVGATTVLMTISFAALVFSGPLEPHLGAGIGNFLFGSAIAAVLAARASALPSAVANAQDAPAAILAIAAASVAAAVPAGSAAALPTVLAMTAVATVVTALAFGLLGTLRLANLVRYVPYPVIGGFLAGTGWFLLDGGVRLVTGSGIRASTLPLLAHQAAVARWLPALIVAVIALAMVRRGAGPLALPALLAAAAAAFHLVLWVLDVPLGRARADGWLLGPFPDQGVWQPPTPTTLQQARWDLIADNAGTLGILLIIALMALLLNVTGLEAATRSDADLNRELNVAAVANVLGGLGGSTLAYHSLSLSALSRRMAPPGRLTGTVVSVVLVLTLLGGTHVLEFLPTLLPGAALVFLGLDFLIAWLYDARVRLTRGEHAIVIVITGAMASIGVLEGVALGILLAMVLFIVEYSRGTPIRHARTGRDVQSNVDRPPAQRTALRERGDSVIVLELHRFIFFGTANRLLDAVRTRLDASTTIRFVVLDFRRVTGLDAAAGSSFTKIGQLARDRDVALVCSGLSPRMRDQLGSQVAEDAEGSWRFMTDLDHAVEWCESQVLADVAHESGAAEPLAVTADLTGLIAHMAPRELPVGTVLIEEGQYAAGLYYLRAGNLTAQIERDGVVVRLRKMRPGVFVGELSLYADAPASATVVADEPSTVLFLSAEDLARLDRERPAAAAAIHRHIARLTSERLLDATTQLTALR